MRSGVVGIVLYYWIFIIGALFVAKLMGFAADGTSMIKLLVVLTVFYAGFMFLRITGKKKREAQRPQSVSTNRPKGSKKRR